MRNCKRLSYRGEHHITLQKTKKSSNLTRSIAMVIVICVFVASLGGCKKETDKLNSSFSLPLSSSDIGINNESDHGKAESSVDTFETSSSTSADPTTSESETDNRPKVNVADYGAFVNDGVDDTEAIRKSVFAAAAIGGGCVVQLEEGIYNIDKVSKDTPAGRYDTLYFDGIYNVSIEGYGATLLLGDPFTSGFGFVNSGNITIKGVTIDYAILPWVQGEVVSISQKNRSFVLKSNIEGKTCLDDPRWNKRTATYGLIRDKDDPRIPRVGQGFFYGVAGNCEKIDDGEYQFHIDSDTYKNLVGSEIRKGTKIIINNRGNSCGAFYFAAIDGYFNIEDCTIYASVGTAYCFGRINGNVKINNCRTQIKSGRWCTTCADGIYAPNLNGSLTLTNSLIEGTGDDTINLHGKGTTIEKIINNRKIETTSWHAPTVGDTIYILDHINGRYRGEAIITEVEEIKKLESQFRRFRITFDKEIPGMLGTGKLGTSDLVVFRKALSPGTVISNNILRYNRGAGVKANAMDIQITNNTIEYTVFAGITLYDIPSLMESAGMIDGVISGNKLKHTAYQMGAGDDEKAAQISIGARTSVMGENDYGVAQGYMHRNLTIKNNIIEGIRKNGIYLSSAENVVLENNTVVGGSEGVGKNLAGIVLSNVKNVQVKNNTVNNVNPNLAAGIKVLEKCKEVTLSGNKFSLASSVKEVIDIS